MYTMAPQRCIFLPYLLLISLSFFLPCYSTTSPGESESYVRPGYDSRMINDEAYIHNSINRRTRFGRLLASVKTVSVNDFGAKGDGSDDTQAFKNAWQAACSSSAAATLLVPKKKYLVKPIRFAGPCKAALTVQIYGTIEASANRAYYKEDGRHWLLFDSVQNLQVKGGGTIDGNGNTWWENSCKINKALPCKYAPTALTFYRCKNIIVKNLKIQHAQQIHLSFEKSTNVQASRLTVTSPQTSPNTDGIHVTDTQNIQISSCVIGTGDDCISIVSGSQKVKATGITCGPGHGISIGSLGSGNSKAFVSDVLVNGAKLYGTQNGLRIKTWQGGSGSVSNIKFLNVQMNNVDNPIIIDQSYCDQDKPCKEKGSSVQVKDVIYQNIQGTSASDVAINFSCSKEFPCEGIVLQNVNLKRGAVAAAAKASCSNVKLSETGVVAPHCP
ncbi:polygalacturonase-like isoform X1 [Diospyros lotus]|uniref:polygalacturonase-like isoform X1 n=2 Tax=Diospyros lotus TaxID=55363 RepID=UPI002250A8AA|nr:polygalacturonase-like isoform X1 [Diospyros lotus]